jgi:hypothetical protein
MRVVEDLEKTDVHLGSQSSQLLMRPKPLRTVNLKNV